MRRLCMNQLKIHRNTSAWVVPAVSKHVQATPQVFGGATALARLHYIGQQHLQALQQHSIPAVPSSGAKA